MTTHGQVYIESTGVYLYKHHDAYYLPEIVHDALREYDETRKLKWILDKRIAGETEILTGVITKHIIQNSECGNIEIGATQSTDIEWLITITKNDQIKIECGYMGFDTVLCMPLLEYIDLEIPPGDFFMNWEPKDGQLYKKQE